LALVPRFRNRNQQLQAEKSEQALETAPQDIDGSPMERWNWRRPLKGAHWKRLSARKLRDAVEPSNRPIAGSPKGCAWASRVLSTLLCTPWKEAVE
jgi:hypothetical protein